ncbi:MAG: LolA-like putative outer membrane lipoprotein chaperone [Bacteroidales bacterium]|jgi:outer membrane lipoprotein carrier protein|nr:outer membrane lipoprotein carrier protein LolA [Bacteroidales bacterium]MDI9575849.1 LolA-like putative outer membrane lipoprotein chaperone [Bacteroidota bacterium]MDD2593146.1 LolA-like putative outer membrane lipoprotein chaperone [Bacteroidales bacterium]MDD3755318.1 LolA-like putative outer membrane lipoprotein chaperone [Bacteroidales bacterium]MDY0400867.1 LolA-like putative outer membrane lipoprotein chaperone [Bacteroidales bacterium]
MKNIKTFFIILFLPFALVSQVIDPRAQQILDESYNKIKNYKSIQIDFTYTIKNEEKNTRQQNKGSIMLKGNKYKLVLDDQIIFCDGSTKWTFFVDDNEVQINNVDVNEELLPNYILLADYKKDHYPKFIREMPKSNKVINIIDLVPKTSKSYYKIRLEIDNNTKLLNSASIYNKDNNTFIYVIDRFITDIDAPDSIFVFNPKDHPGVFINDMR